MTDRVKHFESLNQTSNPHTVRLGPFHLWFGVPSLVASAWMKLRGVAERARPPYPDMSGSAVQP
jgi:hypothetical protein